MDNNYLLRMSMFISLDMTSFLVKELEMQEFWNYNLQDNAREVIRTLNSGYATTGIDFERSDIIFENLTSSCSKHVIASLTDWGNKAFPTYERSAQLWIWSVILGRLCDFWNSSSVTESLPLVSADLISVRLAIREYTSNQNNLRYEMDTGRGYCLTEWDSQVLLFGQLVGVIFDLQEITQSIYSERFWTEMKIRLTSEHLRHLSAWGKDFGIQEEMPEEYLHLP